MEEKNNKLDPKEIRNELEEIAFRHEKRFKLLTFSIFFLVTLAIGISTYTLHYLLRFDAEEIDTFVSGNLKRKNAKLEYSLPRMALALLAQSKQKVSWNPSQKKWFLKMPQENALLMTTIIPWSAAGKFMNWSASMELSGMGTIGFYLKS